MSLLQDNRHPLWDLPTRFFHWAIVCLLPLSWLTAETDNYEWHSWIGYSVLVLVAFRICWGFIGSRHSRFSDFLVGPARQRCGQRRPQPARRLVGGGATAAVGAAGRERPVQQ
mgnify:CR=1 FL=1